ncbi:MAG: hypothetical protein ACI8ZX_001511 [Planctomycetota bacterium]|jgi:hypothetical protein
MKKKKFNGRDTVVLTPFKVCPNPIEDMLVLEMNNSYLGSTAKIDSLLVLVNLFYKVKCAL